MLKLRKNKKGFTLVELIVVIAIMAILAGTVTGVLVSSQQKAKNSTAETGASSLADQLVVLLGNPSDYVVTTMPALADQTDFCAITVSGDTATVQFNALAIVEELRKDDNYANAIGNYTVTGDAATLGTTVPKAGTNQYSIVAGTGNTTLVISYSLLGGSNKYKSKFTIGVNYINDQFTITAA